MRVPLKYILSCLLAYPAILYGQATAPAPYGPLPSEAQLKWHETDLYAMVCFGLNTYTDKEWGYGDVSPALFDPSGFDASQITATLKEAGFKGVLLVAKHHDGFCLWPTKTTSYSVAASPWMNGKGDMVKSFEMAARKSGLKFGIYNSPWDRNNASYGSAAYIKIYRQQLEELHQNYGPLFISWYDGANGGDGYYGGAKENRQIDRASYYQWNETWGIVRRLQPGAVIFSDMGPDVRWVGNENGFAATTSWATFTPKGGKDAAKPAPGDSRWQEAPEGHRDGKSWMPAECDVPLRSGWYYHATQDNSVKSPRELFDIYLKSVGRGAALDIGIAPDKRGILNEKDVAALKGFGKLLRETFSTNLLERATIQASNVRGADTAKFGPAHLLDNGNNTYWATDDSITTPECTLKLNGIKQFNIIRLREHIALGQRVEAFAVDILQNNSWQEITHGTSIGAQRLIRLPHTVVASQIRLRILRSPVCPALSEFSIFAEADIPAVTQSPAEVLPLSSKGWRILSAPGGKHNATALTDNKLTIWQGPFNRLNPVENAIVIDMGKQQEISGLLFTPPAEAFGKGIIDKYQLYISTDGSSWTAVSGGEFGNIRANPVKQQVSFPGKKKARYLKFLPLHLTSENDKIIRITGIGIY
jgi:alpha-L-fucosidase